MGNICVDAMNAVNSDLNFTIESVHDFVNRRLATLDFEIEVLDNQIVYSYFQKAMSDHQKFSILSNEVIRRMFNVSNRIGEEERVKLVDEFTRELKNSGYTRRRAREIVVCGVERKKLRRERQGQKFHRRGKSTLTEKTKK